MKCKNCGKEFNAKNSQQLYCGSYCQRAAAYGRHKIKKPEVKAICPICGNTYIKLTGRQKYCSVECREKSMRKGQSYEQKPKRLDRISRLVAEARAAGMTYGQYQALKLKEFSRVDIGEING